MSNKNSFSSSAEVFSWLSRFINLERGQSVKSFRIDRMEALAEIAGHPERCAPSIHIAGSKGKGSVTGMLAAMLTADGRRAARYMSPHVIDIRERICLNDKYLDEDIYRAAGDELREITEVKIPAAKNPLFDTSNEEGAEPTFFELLTLYFFLCAKHARCDVMVVETGMGGRLDSTNILDPLVSVITLIELEHTSFLGNTIAAIAGEKAGIIKQGKPLILAGQCDEVLEVFKEKTQKKNSQLIYLPEAAEISNVKINPQGTDFTFAFPAFPTPLVLSIPIPGKAQAENAALAIAAVKTAFPQIGEDAIRRGLGTLNIPARFEKLRETPPFVIDGAHTPQSLKLCIETFCSLYGEGGVLIFGCAADKDAAAMAKTALPHFAKVIITTPGTFKISNPALVYETFAKEGGEKVQFEKDTEKAVQLAMGLSSGKELPVLATGSFYLVAEIRKFVKP